MTDKLHDIFALIDSDGGGSICLEEVNVFVNALPVEVDGGAVSEAFAAEDATTSDGAEAHVNVDGFCGLIEKLTTIANMEVPEMVAHFTHHCYSELYSAMAEGTDCVRLADLSKLLEAMETNLSGEELHRVFKRHDEDGSGTIDVEEFVGIIEEIGQGMPISKLVRSFKEARLAAKERMRALKNRFGTQEEETPALQTVPKTGGKEAPQTSVVESPQVCHECPILRSKISDLEAMLAAEREEHASEMAATASAAQVQDQKTVKTKRKVVKKSDKEKELAERCEQLERQLDAARDAGAQHGGGGGGGSQGDDTAALLSQIWVLETALEIRSRELHTVREQVTQFAASVRTTDAPLAQKVLATLGSLAQSFESEARSVLGEPIESVLGKKRKGRKQQHHHQQQQQHHQPQPQPPSDSAEVTALRAEVQRLRVEASSPRGSQSGDVRLLAKKDRELEELRVKYKAAQEAIVAAAGVEYENEIKLHEARRALEAVAHSPMRHGSASVSPHAQSVSPSNPTYTSPRPLMPTHYSPFLARSTSPRRQK